MAAVVCTTAFQLSQLTNIDAANLGDYNWTVAGVPSNDPAYVRLFQAYALAELQGATAFYLYADPYGKQPQTVGILTALASLADKSIADAIQFRYTVQSINTTQVLLNLRMSGLYNSAIGYSQALYNAAIGHANDLHNIAIGYSQALYNAAVNHANGLYNLSIQHADGLYNLSIQHADGLYNLSIQHADVLYNAGLQNTANVAHALESNINAVQTQLTQLVGTDVTSLTRSITDVANTAEQQVKNAVSQAEAVAGTLAASAGASAVAKVVAALQPQIDAIKTETDQCLTPLCDSVTPNARQLGNLGKLLHGATDALMLGGLVAFLAECAHDPQAAASEVESVLGTVVHGAATGARDLIGV